MRGAGYDWGVGGVIDITTVGLEVRMWLRVR